MPGVRHSGVPLQICRHLRRHQVHRIPHLPPRLVAHQVRQSSHTPGLWIRNDLYFIAYLDWACPNLDLMVSDYDPSGGSPLQINRTHFQQKLFWKHVIKRKIYQYFSFITCYIKSRLASFLLFEYSLALHIHRPRLHHC
jgi:hypothetical protein